MVASKKYRERYTTAVSMEKSSYDLTRHLGILLSDALQTGIDVIIQTMITQKSDKLDSKTLELIAETQAREIAELRAVVTDHDAVSVHVDQIAALQAEERSELELIRVYDPDEELIVPITRKLARQLNLKEYVPPSAPLEAP